MSLKHFHVVFIVVAILCTLGFAAWALMTRVQTVDIRALGWFSLVLGIGLSFYGAWFLKKSKHIVI